MTPKSSQCWTGWGWWQESALAQTPRSQIDHPPSTQARSSSPLTSYPAFSAQTKQCVCDKLFLPSANRRYPSSSKFPRMLSQRPYWIPHILSCRWLWGNKKNIRNWFRKPELVLRFYSPISTNREIVSTSKGNQEISTSKFMIVMSQLQEPHKTEPSRKAEHMHFLKDGFRTSQVVQRLLLQCRGHELHPWSRNKDPTCHAMWPKDF